MGRLGRLGLEQPVRYERQRPGELVHIDVKKLGRIRAAPASASAAARSTTTATYTDADGKRRRTVGWEYVHVAVDDYSRLAYAEVLADEKATTAVGFLAPRARVLPPLRHHASSSCSPTTAAATARRRARTRLPHDSASATSAPAPTGRRQTAKQNASSAPCSPAGPTARSTAQATNAPPPLTAGSGTTTIDARHSALGHQPPVTRTNLLGSYI